MKLNQNQNQKNLVATKKNRAVQISGGQTVLTKFSGETVSLTAGQTVLAKVSGDTIALTAGTAVAISGQTIIAETSVQAVKISGQTVSLAAGISASVASTTLVSGNVLYLVSRNNAAQISGQLVVVVVVSGVVSTSVSGNAVRTSGDVAYLVSGQNAVQISGQLVSV